MQPQLVAAFIEEFNAAWMRQLPATSGMPINTGERYKLSKRASVI